MAHNMSIGGIHGFACPIAGQLAQSVPPEPGEYELPIKTLVLVTTEDLTLYPEWILTSMQQQHDIVMLLDPATGGPSKEAINLKNSLYDTNGNPNYNSIVFETLQLGYVRKTDESEIFESALDSETWTAVDEMCLKFHLRKVILASSSLADESLIAYKGMEGGSSGDATISFFDTDFAKNLLYHVKSEAECIIGQVNEFVRTIYWYYPATIADGAEHIKPFMKIKPNCNGPNEARILQLTQQMGTTVCKDIEWIGGFIMEKNGIEEMHFLVNSNLYGHHGFVVSDIWFTWMNRGVWPGMRRVPFVTQVDDIFLATGTYNTTLDRQALADEPVYRITGTDLDLLTKWQFGMNSRMPNGSRYAIEMAFNGAGWFDYADLPDNANAVAISSRDHFFWVSHTWRHIDMYCPFSDCVTHGHTKYEDIKFELEKNEWMAKMELFFDVEDSKLDFYATWSAQSLVTPRISGLNHSEAIQAMRDNGITSAVGDNSRVELRPENPWHGLLTNVRDRLDRSVFIIPRFATRVYFDCSLPIESKMEHASIYGPKCYGYDRAQPVSYPYKCSKDTFKYSRDLEYSEILSIEAYETGRNLLSYRTDPYMFHQANLRFFNYEGRTQSLLTMWVEAITAEFLKYKDLPLFSIKQDDLRIFYQQRMDRDACNISAKWVYENNVPTKLVMTGDKDCTAKLTRVANADSEFVAQTTEEHYGFDRTRDVLVKANQETVLYIGKTIGRNKKLQKLPYPPANRQPTAFDRRNVVGTFNSFQSLAAKMIFAMEKMLNVKLTMDLEFVNDYQRLVDSSTCISEHNSQEEDKNFELFDIVSLPANEARRRNSDSWYRTMEDEEEKLAKQILIMSRNVTDASKQKIEDTVNRDIANSIDNMENRATMIMKTAFENIQSISAKYDSMPRC
eukprot:CFRG3765T1